MWAAMFRILFGITVWLRDHVSETYAQRALNGLVDYAAQRHDLAHSVDVLCLEGCCNPRFEIVAEASPFNPDLSGWAAYEVIEGRFGRRLGWSIDIGTMKQVAESLVA